MKKIEAAARAKINIFLEIVGRRPDGYHNIESVFCLIELADEITVEKTAGSGVEFACDAIELSNHENLAVRATKAVMADAKIRDGVRIFLQKKIPWGAGLGGGSADAAAAMKSVLELFRAEIPGRRMAEIAAGIGADVPFFLSGAKCAIVEGIGEKITPIALNTRALAGDPYKHSPENAAAEATGGFHLLIVKPDFHISTKNAYSRIKFPLTDPRQIDKISAAVKNGESIEKTAALFFNRFENTAAADHPEISAIKKSLTAAGAAGALMTGSGSAVFGAFSDSNARNAAAKKIAGAFPAPRYAVFKTRTAGAGTTGRATARPFDFPG